MRLVFASMVLGMLLVSGAVTVWLGLYLFGIIGQ